jgi:hypothetical protein
MADGLIDPARAYRRSLQEIYDDQLRAAAPALTNLLSRTTAGSGRGIRGGTSGDGYSLLNVRQATGGGGRRDIQSSYGATPLDASVANGRVQMAAASTPGFWDYWGVKGCANCHGYTPDTLPPATGQSRLPPSYSRRGGSSGSSSQPDWSDRPQCNQQFEADRKICQKAGSAQCWANSSERLGHCNRTGEVGIPSLGFGPPGR